MMVLAMFFIVVLILVLIVIFITSYAVRKMIPENGFSDNQSSNRIFPSTRSHLHSLSK